MSKQRARTVEIDAHAFVEIDFGFGGDHGGEMKDHVGPGGDKLPQCRGIGNVAGHGLDRAGKFLWLRRGRHVE